MSELDSDLSVLRQRLHRRTLLRSALIAASALPIISVSGCSAQPVDRRRLKSMLLVLAPVLLPDTVGLVPLQSTGWEKYLDRLLGDFREDIAKDLDAAALLFDLGARFNGFAFRAFAGLDPKAANAYVELWQNGHSLQRGIITVFKKLVYVSYWQCEETWKTVEYDGPVSVRWGLPSLGNAPLPDDETAFV